jgi:cell division septal protein FtsQ
MILSKKYFLKQPYIKAKAKNELKMKLYSKKKRNIRRKKDLKRIRTSLFHSIILILFITSFIITATGYKYIQNLDYFKVQHVNISGHKKYGLEKIVSLSKIQGETSIFSADLKKISRNLESDPWIYRSVVKRKFPNIIEIAIEEYDPIAIVKLDNYYLIDKNGTIFKKASKNEMCLPKITGLTKKDLAENSKTAQMINSTLDLIRTMRDRNILKNDLTIVMDKNFGITLLNYKGNIKTNLGFVNFSDKLLLLQKINTDLARKGLSAKRISIKSIEKAYITI